jgi:hypothetical protein
MKYRSRLEDLIEKWIRHQEEDYGGSGDQGPVSDQDIHENIREGVSVYGSEEALEKSLEEFFAKDINYKW